MTDRPSQLQKAVVARLLADAGVTALIAGSAVGPAVFASRQPFPNVFPRVLIDTPQVVPSREVSVDELFVTLHVFTKGADCTLKAGAVANAVREALDAPLAISGFEVPTQTFEGANPVGDPDETVEHVVSTFRFLVGPTA